MPSASPIYGARSFAVPQVLARYLQERSVSVEAQTVHGLEFAMRHLIRWVAVRYPTIDSFAQLTREHVLEFARALDDG